MKRIVPLAATALVIAGLALGAGPCRGQNRCLWLNAATAAGVLGGDVQMKVTVAPDNGKASDESPYSAPEQLFGRPDALCEFTRNVDSSIYSLRIDVKTMSDPSKEYPALLSQCSGTRVALKAIGNEAVQCIAKDNGNMSHEEVIGRVRERSFVLTIIRAAVPSGGETLRDDTRNMAEQVAGSLF